MRIETVGCSDSGIGTGFLLSPTEVITVAHVVDQSVVVSLKDAGQRTTGTVVGIDRTRDLALVHADSPLAGYHFTLADSLPAVGDDVAAIGFPSAIRSPSPAGRSADCIDASSSTAARVAA